jgi:hypothetical protein
MTNPIEQLVIQSVEHLKKNNPNFSVFDLEAEAIYLASFVYLKEDCLNNFEIEYISDDLLNKIQSRNYKISDEVFNCMTSIYPNDYGKAEYAHGIQGYKMNIQMTPDYLSYIKNYFRRAHKIGDGNGMILFKSPKNSLWRDDEQKSVSPTERNVYYKFIENSFEVIIPPYNPMVKGRITRRTINEIVCKSFDFNREFVFCYNETISPENLEMIKMYRHDKDDMVVYHK